MNNSCLYWVGRNDGKPLPGTSDTKRWFHTSTGAENEIARISKLDPEGMERGEYYFDTPEEPHDNDPSLDITNQ